jgi:hypothetical protein
MEIQAALASDEPNEMQSIHCPSDKPSSSYIAGFCELVQAERAWRSHQFLAVIEHASKVAKHRPIDPRVAGRTAQLLASLGFVDQANHFAREAARFSGPRFPALRWAQTAIQLGRGRLVEMPSELGLSSSLIAPSIMARIALASAGIEALSLAMESLQKDHFTTGPILDSFAKFLQVRQHAKLSADVPANDPVEAYVKGLHARLAGDLPGAVQWLAVALSVHGDACRAAGEYLAVCRALEQVPAAEAFEFLKTKNTGCVNLPAALAALKVPFSKSRKSAMREKLKDLE